MTDSSHDLIWQIQCAGIITPEGEYRFAPPRKWRFDLCWPDKLISVEVAGNVYGYGRHQRPDGFERDCEKYSEAAIRGYRLLHFTTAMVKDGRALALVKRALQLVPCPDGMCIGVLNNDGKCCVCGLTNP